MDPVTHAADRTQHLRDYADLLAARAAAEGRSARPRHPRTDVIISPLAKRHFVDHTPYDTGSILRLIAHRYRLPRLRGITARDAALAEHHERPLGDLTNALDL